MDDKLIKDYNNSLDYWESAYDNSQNQSSYEPSAMADWKELAPSEKFIKALSLFSNCRNLLDYGCGEGWGSIIIAKTGCKNILSVELSESAVNATIEKSKKYNVDEFIKAEKVTSDWINHQESEKYDGFFCSNVIDVVPEEIADNILKQAYRIIKRNSLAIISLNFYQDTTIDSNNKFEVKHNNYIYKNGILRMVSRTDREWSDIFSKFFSIIKIEHFSWPGETKETRRLFYLQKKG